MNYTFYANISDTDGVLIKTDRASIKVENGAFLHIETENISQEENAKIYVVGSTIVKNISELNNAEVVYLVKKKRRYTAMMLKTKVTILLKKIKK